MLDVSGTPLLAAEGLSAWYGESHILHGANFNVRAGEVVSSFPTRKAAQSVSFSTRAILYG